MRAMLPFLLGLSLFSAPVVFAQAPPAEYLRLRNEGDARLQAGDKSAALKLFEQALEADASQLGVHDRIARLALDLRQKSRGLQALEAMIKLDAKLAQDAEVATLKRQLEAMAEPAKPVDAPTALAVRTAELALKDAAAAFQRNDDAQVQKFALEAREALLPVLLDKGADHLPAWAAAGRTALALKDDHLAAAALVAIEKIQPDYATQPDLLDLLAQINRRPIQPFLKEARTNRLEFLRMASRPRHGAPFVNSLGMKFVPVPGTDVLFSVWETRVRDYQQYVSARNISWSLPSFAETQTRDHPAVNVSWDDAKGFCQWLTQKELAEGKLKPGQRYELPGDVAWSRAAGLEFEAGGTPRDRNGKIKNVYPWGGQTLPPVRNGVPMGNYADAALRRADSSAAVISGYDDGFPYTAPVGSFPANQFGLHDLGGNVWEWCEDWYDSEEKYRALRGASWINIDPAILLSSNRRNDTPDNRRDNIGFRCVMVMGSRP